MSEAAPRAAPAVLVLFVRENESDAELRMEGGGAQAQLIPLFKSTGRPPVFIPHCLHPEQTAPALLFVRIFLKTCS